MQHAMIERNTAQSRSEWLTTLVVETKKENLALPPSFPSLLPSLPPSLCRPYLFSLPSLSFFLPPCWGLWMRVSRPENSPEDARVALTSTYRHRAHCGVRREVHLTRQDLVPASAVTQPTQVPLSPGVNVTFICESDAVR